MSIGNSNIRLGIYLGRHASFAGGIGVYASSLIDSYLQLLAESKLELAALIVYGDSSLLSAHAREAFARGRVGDQLACELKLCELVRPQSRLLGYFIDQLVLPGKFEEDRLFILHSFANLAFLMTPFFQVVTIHDLYQGWPVQDELQPLSALQRLKIGARAMFYRTVFRLQAKRVFLVLTDARQTALEVMKFLPLRKKATVEVVPLGLDAVFAQAQDQCEALAARGVGSQLTAGYVLLTYSEDPRKNTTRALAAWKALPADLRAKGLVILGAHQKQDEIKAVLGETFDKSVHCLPHLPRHELPRYLVSAGALLVPTLAEGFGFPALEAVAMQTPVVTSRLECLEQFAANNVYFVDARDVQSIKLALGAALNSERPVGQEVLHVRTMPEVAGETLEAIFSVYLN